MTNKILFCSPNVQEVYRLYETLSGDFLKAHKHQAEFRITTLTSSKDFCLGAEYVSETELKWLKDAVLQFIEKKLGKVVDKP
jgi:hypothetical protein